ncbi:MAG: hypothetical protein AVDCRST_MAG89-4836, partial [uncultured Gemmatimonadetes bacterium]
AVILPHPAGPARRHHRGPIPQEIRVSAVLHDDEDGPRALPRVGHGSPPRRRAVAGPDPGAGAARATAVLHRSRPFRARASASHGDRPRAHLRGGSAEQHHHDMGGGPGGGELDGDDADVPAGIHRPARRAGCQGLHAGRRPGGAHPGEHVGGRVAGARWRALRRGMPDRESVQPQAGAGAQPLLALPQVHGGDGVQAPLPSGVRVHPAGVRSLLHQSPDPRVHRTAGHPGKDPPVGRRNQRDPEGGVRPHAQRLGLPRAAQRRRPLHPAPAGRRGRAGRLQPAQPGKDPGLGQGQAGGRRRLRLRPQPGAEPERLHLPGGHRVRLQGGDEARRAAPQTV